MKVLFNSQFKAIRRGEFVRADQQAGEFIHVAGEPASLTTAQLQEIAAANKIELPHTKTKAQLQSVIDEALMSNDKIPEQNEKSESEKVEEIVSAGFAAGKKEDDILIEIVTSGVSFRKAGPLFKQTVERLGLKTSTKDLKVSIAELIEHSKELQTWDELQALARKAAKELKGVEEKQAVAAIKAHLKQNEMPIPEKPKGARGATGIKGKVYQFIINNPEVSQEELNAEIERLGKSSEKYGKIYWTAAEFARSFAQANASKYVD